MKKNIIRFACVAFAAIAALSCQKDINEPEQNTNAQDSYELVFNLKEAGSKTTLQFTGGKPDMTWENTPSSYVHIFAGGKESSNVSLNISKDNQTAQIKANFSFSDLYSRVTFKSVIAAGYAGGAAAVPSVQTPTATSFDPAADVLVGESAAYLVTDFILDKTIDMSFARLNAVSQLTVKGLGAGEKVELIEVVAENNIAGALKPFNDFTFAGYADEGSKKITLNFSANNTVASDGTFTTYFTSWAVAPGKLKVKVYTDKNEYSKTSSSAAPAFSFSTLGNLNVTMAGPVPPSYELVTSTPASWEGTYIIVNTASAGSAKVFNGKSSNNAANATVREDEGKVFIESDNTIDGYAWEVSKSGDFWDVMKGGKYLFDNSGINVADNCYTGLLVSGRFHRHSFSYNNGVQMASNSITLLGKVKETTYFGFNGSNFAYSGNSANRVYLFKLKDNGRESQNLVFANPEVKFVLKSDGYKIGETYDAQAFAAGSSYGDGLVSWSSSDPNVAAVDAATGKITIKKEGSVIITAKAASTNKYRGASASYQLTISVPYYQKVTSTDEITSGDKYIIVSKTSSLLGLTSYYHAFDASATSGGYDLNLNGLFGNLDQVVYDNGNKIKASDKVNATQVVIEKENVLISALAKIVGISGGAGYTIKPTSVGKYLYCDMTADVPGTSLSILTYQIAFSDKSLDFSSDWSRSVIINWFNERATIPHSIEFGENGVASIKNAISDKFSIGADLRYIINRYEYINMNILNSFESTAELIAYLSKDSQYAWIGSAISAFGKSIDLGQLVDYLSADLFIYKYIE